MRRLSKSKKFTVYGLLFTVYGLRFTVYCLLFTVYGLKFEVYPPGGSPVTKKVQQVTGTRRLPESNIQ